MSRLGLKERTLRLRRARRRRSMQLVQECSLVLALFVPGMAQAEEQPEDDAALPPNAASPADSAAPDAAATSKKAEKGLIPYDGRNWELGATMGYYRATREVYGLNLEPFNTALGITSSFMSDSGWSVGMHLQYFAGSGQRQIYVPPLTTYEIDTKAESQMTSLALSFAFEQRLDPIIFRYVIDVGPSILTWDFGEQDFLSFAGFPSMTGTSVGLHLAPGIGVMVPIGAFHVGLEGRYRLELIGYGPTSAMGGHAHIGWRL